MSAATARKAGHAGSEDTTGHLDQSLIEETFAPRKSAYKPSPHRSLRQELVDHTRDRLLASNEEEAFSDRDLLCVLLSLCFGTDGAVTVAVSLMAAFGSLHDVLNAPTSRLLVFLQGSWEALFLVRLLRQAIRTVLRSKAEDRFVASGPAEVVDYVRFQMKDRAVQTFRTFYVDSSKRLIMDELTSQGSVAHVVCYPREILKRAIEYDAAGILVARTECTTSPKFSELDYEVYSSLCNASKLLDIQFLDYLLISPSDFVSMQSEYGRPQ